MPLILHSSARPSGASRRSSEKHYWLRGPVVQRATISASNLHFISGRSQLLLMIHPILLNLGPCQDTSLLPTPSTPSTKSLTRGHVLMLLNNRVSNYTSLNRNRVFSHAEIVSEIIEHEQKPVYSIRAE